MWLICLKAIITLFVVVDPIGNIPAFLAATERFDKPSRQRAFTLSVFVALAILLIFAFLGQFILDNVFQIKIADIRITGGILLLILAIRGLVFEDRPSPQADGGHQSVQQVACVPLACPLLAGPGAMVSSLTLWQSPKVGPAITILAMLVVLGLFWLLMRSIDAISRVVGNLIITAVSKVMLVFVGAIGVSMAMQGVLFYFPSH